MLFCHPEAMKSFTETWKEQFETLVYPPVRRETYTQFFARSIQPE